jgi:hypothetical protein
LGLVLAEFADEFLAVFFAALPFPARDKGPEASQPGSRHAITKPNKQMLPTGVR